jgi:putative cell wall-binding protein
MKKTKKALASLAIAGMALTMVPFNAFATGTVPTRLFGTTAAETAVAIADQTGWTGTAILASSASYGMVDALTSGPLAKFLNAPILLQEPGAVLNAYTKAELLKLNVTKVYVTSGTAVINQAVLDELKGMGITVESLGGNDRFDTSVNIAKKMVALGAPVTKVAVAYGWLNQDALSIASIASANNEPILLTEKDSVPASAKAFLAANTGVTSSDVIGGTAVISEATKATLPNATRHYGNTAYDTNDQVIQDFASSLNFSNVFVANGITAIDALAGAPLAAQTKSAIVLTDGTVPAAATFVNSKLTSSSVVTALGGTAVVPESVLTGIVSIVPAVLGVTSVSAINTKQIKVVFNKAVTAASLNVGGAVAVTAPGGLVGPVANGLSADGTTLTLNLAQGQANATASVVTFTGIGSVANSYDMIATFATSVTFNDTSAPSISSITSTTSGIAAGNVVVTFSEPVLPAVAFQVDGTTVAVTDASPSADLTQYTLSNLTLSPTISHTLTVLGATDFVPSPNANAVNMLTQSFQVTVDAVAPTVSLSANSDNAIELTFTKKMNSASVTTGTVQVYNEAGISVYSGVPIADPNDSTGTKFILSWGVANLYTTQATHTFSVFLPGTMADSVGNSLAPVQRAITMTKDTTSPAISSLSYNNNTDGTLKNVVLNVNKAVSATQITGAQLAAIRVTDSNGVDVSTNFLNVAGAITPTAGATTITLPTVASLTASGTYTFYLPAALITDTATVPNTSLGTVLTLSFNNVTTTFSLPEGNVAGVTAKNLDGTETIAINYGTTVKGGNVGGSATVVSNYRLNGVVLPAGSYIYLTANATISNSQANIVLPSGSVVSDNLYAPLTIQNVQNANGTVITPFTGWSAVLGNTSPTLLSAKVVSSTQLILTYNEKMATTLNATDIANDLTFTNGGVTYTPSAVKATNYVGNNTQIVITLTPTAPSTGLNLTQSVQVTTNANTVLKDANGTPNAQKLGITVTATN